MTYHFLIQYILALTERFDKVELRSCKNGLTFLTHYLDIPKDEQSYAESAPLEVTLLYMDPEFGRA